MLFDHIALETSNIDLVVSWYLSILDDPKVLYQDKTWALIESAGSKIAFVTPGQHPEHVAFRIESEIHENLIKTMFPDASWKAHRDGSLSFYARDPSGNIVEFVKYVS